MNIFRKVARHGRDFYRTLLSVVKPYEPMAQGAQVLDSQYASGEWDYLRSIGEAPRFGVVSAYCSHLAAGGSILEIGCGDALLFEKLDRENYGHFTGVDISQIAIDRTRKFWNDKTDFHCSDAETFTPDRLYDLVVFNEVLEYFDDPLALLRRYEAFVSPNGHFVVSMFAGLETARTRKIWSRLADRYALVAKAQVSTLRRYRWNIRVFKANERP
jgi:2-polyprenyl-3-methyl-5-hydroxy-6-metoxy-1,4-benzoquinol methylase